jgi:hypothetical protein
MTLSTVLPLACVACDRDPLVQVQERSCLDQPTIGSNDIVTGNGLNRGES